MPSWAHEAKENKMAKKTLKKAKKLQPTKPLVQTPFIPKRAKL